MKNYPYFIALQKGAADVFQLITLSEFNPRFGTLLRTEQNVRIAIENNEVITDFMGAATNLQVVEGHSLQLQRGFRYYDATYTPKTHAFIQAKSNFDFETGAITAVAIDLKPTFQTVNIPSTTSKEQAILTIIGDHYQANQTIPNIQTIKQSLSAKNIQATDQEITKVINYFQQQLSTQTTLFDSKPEFLVSYQYPNNTTSSVQTFSLQLDGIKGIIGWSPLPEMANIYLATQESIEYYEDLWQRFLKQHGQRKQWKNSEDDIRAYFTIQGILSGIDPSIISQRLEKNLPAEIKKIFSSFIDNDQQNFRFSDEYAFFLNANYDYIFSEKLTELAKKLYPKSKVIPYREWRESHTYSFDPMIGVEQWYADNIFNWFSVLVYLSSPTAVSAPTMARAAEMLARAVSNTQFVSMFEPVPFTDLTDFFAGWLEIFESFVNQNHDTDAFFNYWLSNANPPQAWQNKPWFKKDKWKELLRFSAAEKAEGGVLTSCPYRLYKKQPRAICAIPIRKYCKQRIL
ncbi:MAG: hypothetical protein KatS3mg087_1766 [Patescibacteria group bacterium]|nr:MAG: hypothetical protein KatS3mg087_1766 [Patescibacteria group bacterium]